MGSLRFLARPRAALTLTLALLTGCSGGSPATAPRSSNRQANAGPSTSPSTPTAQAIDVAALTGRIVFSNGTNDIWMVRANGSGLKRLTTNGREDFDPAWSPDGRQIAFRSMRDGNNEVYVMSANGSRQRNVSRDGADDWGPAWISSGQMLWNCARELSRGFHACLANPDGSGLHVIPNDVYVEYPSASPDGTRIAFMSQQPDAHGNDPNYDIFVMNVDGSGLKELTHTPGEDGFPSWSPDGTKIAFSTTRDDCSNSKAADCRTTGDIGPYETIWVMNADGSNQHRLSLQLGMLVDWSPDGRYLVFSPGLNIIRPDGSGLVSLHPSTPGGAEFPDWGA